MGDIVDLAERRPHIAGAAKCLTCGHEWAAVAEIGTVELCCPICNTWKGVFTGMTAPETVWECNCGNQHFYIDPDGPMCSRCGLRHEWER
jgi:hypothetical protein